MDYTLLFNEIMSAISPILVLSGMLAMIIALICMLIDIFINAFTGKGMKI